MKTFRCYCFCCASSSNYLYDARALFYPKCIVDRRWQQLQRGCHHLGNLFGFDPAEFGRKLQTYADMQIRRICKPTPPEKLREHPDWPSDACTYLNIISRLKSWN